VSDSLIGPYEDMFLYRTTVGPEAARAIFLTYLRYLNHLKDHPEWYNAVTRNCTTTLDKPISKAVTNPQPWIYQILLNGTLDELLYNRGRLVTDGLPFKELKSRAHINATAKAADKSLNFSAIIRTNAPGFGNSQQSLSAQRNISKRCLRTGDGMVSSGIRIRPLVTARVDGLWEGRVREPSHLSEPASRPVFADGGARCPARIR
jgi:hypothetical protein